MTEKENKLFYLEKDFYGPRLLLIVAPDIQVATKLLDKMLEEMNYKSGDWGELKEFDLDKVLERFNAILEKL